METKEVSNLEKAGKALRVQIEADLVKLRRDGWEGFEGLVSCTEHPRTAWKRRIESKERLLKMLVDLDRF